MKHSRNKAVRRALQIAVLGAIVSAPVMALEVITEQDFVAGIITSDKLVKVADNAIFLLDTSSSMNEKYRDTGKTKRDLVESFLKKRNSYYPDLGQQYAVYAYTPWEEFYSLQPYNREKLATALDEVSKKSPGPTPLKKGLEKLEKILPSLSGRTAVFIFTDGTYTGGNPRKVANQLAREHDVCYYAISTAKEGMDSTLQEYMASLNACSRVIPLEYFLNRPAYLSGALFDVVATANIVTLVETRISVQVDNINFGFDKTELNDKDMAELDELGEFMNANPESYAAIAGYTDNTGPKAYNEMLSEQRAEIVAGYLADKFGIGPDRMVLHWYGPNNPLSSNDTRQGRAGNRRVEVAIGGV
jgi:OOP family OmpA-OmpF porin